MTIRAGVKRFGDRLEALGSSARVQSAAATGERRMTSRTRTFGVAVLALVSLTTSASTAAAECVGFRLDHYKKHADLIFSGAIRELRDLDWRRTLVTFEVDRVWKGNVGKRVVLHQVLSIDSFRFVGTPPGKEYLVFASRLEPAQRALFELTARSDAFSVPICGGGTRALPEVDQDTLRKLGRARNPR